ncbi:hypothetical protein Q8W17_00050, partial [Photobacterium damselae subsp. piscicida]|nr:hypothetical protein [Photobacterium damselae subsp. piscicida]
MHVPRATKLIFNKDEAWENISRIVAITSPLKRRTKTRKRFTINAKTTKTPTTFWLNIGFAITEP